MEHSMREKESAKEYTIDLQRLFVEFLAQDKDLFARVNGIIDPLYFDRELRKAVEFIQEHSMNYSALPTREQILATTGTELQELKDTDERHQKWFVDEFETFCKHKALESAILQSADLLEQGEYGPVERMIKEAVQIGLTRDMGTDYFEDPKARLQALKDNNGVMPTGWKNFDKKLFGGFNRGELNIFAGGSGAGKSLFLQNLACNYVEQGMNCIYITLELSENLTAMRIDAMMTATHTRDIYKDLDTVDLKVKMKAKESGALRIKYIASGATAIDIRAYIKEIEIQSGKECDVILIDYLDLLMPINKRVSPSDLKRQICIRRIKKLSSRYKCHIDYSIAVEQSIG